MLRKLTPFNRFLPTVNLVRNVAANLSPDTVLLNNNNKDNHVSTINNSLDSKLEELQHQIDQLALPLTPPLDLNDIPLSNVQLKHDYRIKQFVTNEQDELMLALRSAQSFEELFAIVRSNERRMYSNHIAIAFSSIFTVGRSAVDRVQFVQSILSNADFKRLCSLTINKMRYMEPNEVLSLLKTLTFLSMNSRTLIMSGVLQMIRYQINEFQADELVLLDYLLSLQRKDKEEKNNFLDALYMAVPMVFESKIRSKEVDFNNVDSLLKYFSLASNRKINGKYVNQLMLALKTQQNCPQFDVQMSNKILARICSLPVDTDFNLDFDLIGQICKICSQKIISGLNDAHNHHGRDRAVVTSNRILNQIGRLYCRVLNKRLLFSFYDTNLLNMTLDHLYENFDQLNLDDAYHLIYNLSHLNHYDKRMLEKFYFMFLENYEHYINQTSIRPGGLVYAFFTPLKFDKFDLRHLFNLILNPKKVASLRGEFDSLISIVRNLCILGIHEPTEVYEEFFRLLYNDKSSLFRRRYVLKTLRMLYMEMCLNADTLPEVFVQHRSKVESLLAENDKESEFGIQNQLKAEDFDLVQIFGPNRIHEPGYRTRLGHRIGLVGVYDSNDNRQFVPLNDEMKEKVWLEDIQLPAGQKLVHLLIGNDWVCKQPQVYRPVIDFYLKTLKHLDMVTVVIDLNEWNNRRSTIKDMIIEDIESKLQSK